MSGLRVARLDELWSGDMQPFEVAGCKLLLIRYGARVHAYEDRCPHQGVPLSSGRLDGTVLTCAMHRWQFDARSGFGINPPHARLHALAVAVENGEVYVATPPAPGVPDGC